MENTRHLGEYGVITKDGKALLVKKEKGAYKGKYDLPGGTIEHWEKSEETLKREIMEETGMTIKDYKIFEANSVLVEVIDGKNKFDADGLDS